MAWAVTPGGLMVSEFEVDIQSPLRAGRRPQSCIFLFRHAIGGESVRVRRAAVLAIEAAMGRNDVRPWAMDEHHRYFRQGMAVQRWKNDATH